MFSLNTRTLALMGLLSTLALSVQSASAALNTPVSCSSDPNFSNTCDQCFINTPSYLGEADTGFYDMWYASPSGDQIFINENKAPVSIDWFYSGDGVLQSNITDNSAFQYVSPILTDPTYGDYKQFAANSQGRILESLPGKFIKFAGISPSLKANKRTKPLYQMKYTFNYWKIGQWNSSVKHQECVLTYPKFCGDGVVDAPQETCDDGDANGSQGKCNATCNGITTPTPKPGVCGPDNGTTVSSDPTRLCTAGVAQNVTLNGTTYTWICKGADGGTDANCNAQKKIDAVCGSDHGKTLGTSPVNLCSVGTPTSVQGSGPWNWTCTGINGGATVSCNADKTTTPPPPTGVCDQIFSDTLRVGQSYSFPDSISNNNSFPYTLKSFDVKFRESDDMNQDGTTTGYSSFLWYGQWGPGKQIPAGQQDTQIIYAFPKYLLSKAPAQRKSDNIRIEYTVNFSDQNGDHSHKECIDYAVNWCGDGIVNDGEQCDPAAPGQSSTTCDPVTCMPKAATPGLTIKKFAKGQDAQTGGAAVTVGSGEIYPYTFEVTNISNVPAPGAKVVDVFPDAIEIISTGAGTGWSCTQAGQVMTCFYKSSIAPGAKAPIITAQARIRSTVAAGTPIRNVVGVCVSDPSKPATDPANNCEVSRDECKPTDTNYNPTTGKCDPSTVIIPGPGGIDLAIKKYIDSNDAQPGSPVSTTNGARHNYIIRVQNVGTATATGTTTVKDILPAGVSATGTITAPNWSCSLAGATLTCTTTQQVAGGASFTDITVPFVVTATTGATVRNDATVHNPNETPNSCYMDNRMPSGSEQSCEKDPKNTDPAVFTIGNPPTGGSQYIGKKCVNNAAVCANYTSYDACVADLKTSRGLTDAQAATYCYPSDATGVNKCQTETLICNGGGGPGGPGGGGGSSGSCGDGVLQPNLGEECDIAGGAVWCVSCKLTSLTTPGANPITDLWMTIPVLAGTRQLGYSWLDGQPGKVAFGDYRVVVGQGTKVFTLADTVNFGIKTKFPAPLMIEASKPICLQSEGSSLNNQTICTTFGEAARLYKSEMVFTREIDGKQYVVMGQGDFQAQKADKKFYTYAVSLPSELPLFKGPSLYSTSVGGSNVGLTLNSAFFGQQPGMDGKISLISYNAQSPTADSAVKLLSFEVRVSNAAVSSVGSSANRALESFLNRTDVLKDFLGKTVVGYTSTTTNQSNTTINRVVQPIASLRGAQGGGVSSVSDLVQRYAVNGNPSILAVTGDLTINCPSGSTMFTMDGVRTVVVEGNLIIRCNLGYASGDNNSSWAWIAKNGDIKVYNGAGNLSDGAVTNMAGVFVAIKETAGGNLTYDGNVTTQKILRIEGSVYGNAKPLFDSRLYARATGAYDILTTGTIINYSNRALVSTPPLLSQYLGNYQVQRVVQ